MFIADWERRTIWPAFAKQDPDIMLSIGTGFDASPPVHAVNNPRPVPKRGIRNFVKKFWGIGAGAILEDMNSELMWEEFIESIGLKSPDSEGFERYQRLNPHLKPPIPRLDAVDQLENLQQVVKEYTSNAHYSTKITLISSMMVASLFYFDFYAVSMEDIPDTKTWHSRANVNLKCEGNQSHLFTVTGDSTLLMSILGRIKCRVGSVALAQKMENCRSSDPRSLFLIGEKHRPISEMEKLETKLSPGDGTRSHEKISYNIEFTLKDTDRDTDMCIFLSLWGNHSRAISISGFPRLLFSDAICEKHVHFQLCIDFLS